MTTNNPTIIHKKRATLLKSAKAGFRVPEVYSFFDKIRRDKGVLANSRCENGEEIDHQKEKIEEVSKSIVTRSASLPLSGNGPLMRREQKQMPFMRSLPKIQKKSPQNVQISEIIKSELGCFNYYDILRRKEQLSQKRHQGNQLSRVSSFISDDQQQIDEEQKPIEEKEIKYEDYDKILMEQQHTFYRRRVFKLKHKADWCISK